MNDVLKINERDNVAVALSDIAQGSSRSGTVLKDDIPGGHKFALEDIGKGEPVIKYGFQIGRASRSIKKGEWVHTHNLVTALSGKEEYSYSPSGEVTGPGREAYFYGYRRKDGRAGIRNEIWIIPTVGCVSGIAKAIEKRMSGKADVIAFSHPYGCSQTGEDQINTRKLLAALAVHPNAGGVLLLGLGCENSGVDSIMGYIPGDRRDRIRTLVCQEAEDEILEAERLISGLSELAALDKREKIPVSELVLGLKCGGSDGLSGITANPVIGRLSDIVISSGGSTILTEVPEMFGAETLLMERCVSEDVFKKTVGMINGFKDYFIRNGQEIYENPSPGNKKGGITTLEEKSLGCTQKSGTARVKDVLSYAEPIKEKGLSLLYSPGNDLVSSTALAASGAQIVVFSTGRGTPFSSPVPTVKISSNTKLFMNKSGWIDFNAGTVAEGRPIEDCAEELFERILSYASGEQTKSEKAGYKEMALFKNGVTL